MEVTRSVCEREGGMEGGREGERKEGKRKEGERKERFKIHSHYTCMYIHVHALIVVTT